MRRMKTVADLLRWEPYLRDDRQAALLSVECPERIGRKRVPDDLNGLTLEQLDRFWQCRTAADLFTTAGLVLFGWNERRTMRADAFAMMGVVNRVTSELQRIASLFEGIASRPTPQEMMAGCESLDFGTFGLADWYARRMGLQSHDAAFSTPWVRIYQCRANDAAVTAFQRRLEDIKTREYKSRQRL